MRLRNFVRTVFSNIARGKNMLLRRVILFFRRLRSRMSITLGLICSVVSGLKIRLSERLTPTHGFLREVTSISSPSGNGSPPTPILIVILYDTWSLWSGALLIRAEYTFISSGLFLEKCNQVMISVNGSWTVGVTRHRLPKEKRRLLKTLTRRLHMRLHIQPKSSPITGS